MKLLVDCDGVLTDGRFHINHEGNKLFKSFHTRDVRAIRELISVHGFEVIIVTADEWAGIEVFAEKVGAVVHYARDKNKLPFDDYIAVGDDAWDVPMLRRAVRAYAPKSADWSVRRIPGSIILETNGGAGVIAELLRHLIENPLR